jgi:tetratricopeptide (TPR) repeat protein
MISLEPKHPGAVHLFVHLFESSTDPQRALPQADLLESLMPKAGHIVHMPSHIYIRVGQYEKAIANNERSLAADKFLLSAWGAHPFPDIGSFHSSARNHAVHALDVLRYAAMLQGNYRRSLEAARAMPDASHGMMAMNPRQQRPPATWLVQKIFGKWDALMAEAPPPSDRLFLQGVWHYFSGSAYAGRREMERAKEELGRLRRYSRMLT